MQTQPSGPGNMHSLMSKIKGIYGSLTYFNIGLSIPASSGGVHFKSHYEKTTPCIILYQPQNERSTFIPLAFERVSYCTSLHCYLYAPRTQSFLICVNEFILHITRFCNGVWTWWISVWSFLIVPLGICSRSEVQYSVHGIFTDCAWLLLSFKAECGGFLSDLNGVILSPGFPGNYPSGLDCNWTVKLPIGFGLYPVTFEFFFSPNKI